jgi:hypothetical protein
MGSWERGCMTPKACSVYCLSLTKFAGPWHTGRHIVYFWSVFKLIKSGITLAHSSQGPPCTWGSSSLLALLYPLCAHATRQPFPCQWTLSPLQTRGSPWLWWAPKHSRVAVHVLRRPWGHLGMGMAALGYVMLASLHGFIALLQARWKAIHLQMGCTDVYTPVSNV